MSSAFLVVVANVLAGFELVLSAAIRALRMPFIGNIEVNLGVTIPDVHVCQRIGAINAPVSVEVAGFEFDSLRHDVEILFKSP